MAELVNIKKEINQRLIFLKSPTISSWCWLVIWRGGSQFQMLSKISSMFYRGSNLCWKTYFLVFAIYHFLDMFYGNESNREPKSIIFMVLCIFLMFYMIFRILFINTYKVVVIGLYILRPLALLIMIITPITSLSRCQHTLLNYLLSTWVKRILLQ